MSGDKPLQILVVEDDFFVKAEIKRALKQLGHTVIGEAASGKKGVEETLRLSPDVVLMDIKMSGMDGIEAASIIQHRQPTPIIFLTAHESAEMVEEASKAGASAYLTKPPNELDIERALMISLARHKDVMELRTVNAALEKKTADLELALSEINALRGMLPICSNCKKIRDEKGYWKQVEKYIAQHTNVEITHSCCPDCVRELYPDIADEIIAELDNNLE